MADGIKRKDRKVIESFSDLLNVPELYNSNLIIKDEKLIHSVFKDNNYFFARSESFRYKLWEYLAFVYRTQVDYNEKAAWHIYAQGQRSKVYRTYGSDSGTYNRNKLISRATRVSGNERNEFIRLNYAALYRGIINKAHIIAPISVDPPVWPELWEIKKVPEGIEIIWQDYYPEKGRYSGGSIGIYFTLYLYMYARIGKYSIRIHPARIVYVTAHPSPQRFILKHIILWNNHLIKIEDCDSLSISAQMDTIVVVDDFAPKISAFSNIERLEYVKGESANSGNKQYTEFLSQIEPIPPKIPKYCIGATREMKGLITRIRYAFDKDDNPSNPKDSRQ